MVLVIFEEDTGILIVSGREIRLGLNGAALMRRICGKLGWYGGKCYGELGGRVVDLVVDEAAAGMSLGALGEEGGDVYRVLGNVLRRAGLRVDEALKALLAMGVDEEILFRVARVISGRIDGLRELLALLEAKDEP